MASTNKRDLMGETKFLESYSRYLPELKRHETWEEAVERVMQMHKKYYSEKMSNELADLMEQVQDAYSNKLFLGAQRALQFGGDQLLKKHAKMYNCSATYCDRPKMFAESMYLLLCGCGVGFSVQKHHVAKLPTIHSRTEGTKEFTIPDSIEGWSQAMDILIASFMKHPEYPEYFKHKIYFDFSEIRPKGALISGGFKAPGPEPLRLCLLKIENLLNTELETTNTVRPIIAYDILMHAADAVISGGVRRSATIALFSKDDEDMVKAKTGNWYETNPQRGRSNNSAVLLRDEVTKEEFDVIIKSVMEFGEPGFIFTSDTEHLYNPCVEIGMKGYTADGRSGFQMCNLTEINGSLTTNEEIFYHQCKMASIMGTLQAGYTNFRFLSSASKEIVEREALIGVGITGIMNNPQILTNEEILKNGAEIVKKWNKITADLIGINQAARTTCVKPSGNSSVLLGCSSGIHGEHSNKYIRHVQLSKDNDIAQRLFEQNPCMCEDSVWNTERDFSVAFPVVVPEGSLIKENLLGVKQLEFVKLVQNSWVKNGANHELCVDKTITHNVSNTITIDDWDAVANYIYENRYSLCGVSLLSSFGDRAYAQAPFTEVLSHQQIVDKYGEQALFTSALIEVGLEAFNGDLWTGCNTVAGYGEVLTDSHEHLLKRDFVRRVTKFAKNFKSLDDCLTCLKDVYILHKWWKIEKNYKEVSFDTLKEKEAIDADTLAGQSCSGGACELTF